MTIISDHTRGVLLAAVGILILSPDALIVRLIETDLWTLLFWRGLFTTLALAVYFFVHSGRKVLTHVHVMGGAGVLAGVFFAITSILFITALTLTTVSNTLVIISAAPLFTAILSLMFLREHVSVRTWIATFTVLAGITIIFSGSLGGGAAAGRLIGAGDCLFYRRAFHGYSSRPQRQYGAHIGAQRHHYRHCRITVCCTVFCRCAGSRVTNVARPGHPASILWHDYPCPALPAGTRGQSDLTARNNLRSAVGVAGAIRNAER